MYGLRVVTGAFVVSVLALAAGACGGGGDSGTSTGSDLDAFCDKVEAYDEKADFSDEATGRAYADFETVAPEQIKGDIGILRAALDTDVVGDTRTVAAGDRFTAYVEQGCGIDLGNGDSP
jgi:hypothetical protein